MGSGTDAMTPPSASRTPPAEAFEYRVPRSALQHTARKVSTQSLSSPGIAGTKGKLLVARFNVDNVLDANYWAGGNLGATQLFLGTPRTFRVSLTADFEARSSWVGPTPGASVPAP